MPIFIVFETNITDPEALYEYRAKTGPLLTDVMTMPSPLPFSGVKRTWIAKGDHGGF